MMEVTPVGRDARRAPSAAHPSLLPHQLATVQAMLDVERCCPELDVPSARATLSTRMGVFGDKAGSGKSFVLCALLMSDVEIPPPTSYVRQLSLHMSATVRMPESEEAAPVSRLSILVVPHNIVTQWTEVIGQLGFTEAEFLVVGRAMDLGGAMAVMEALGSPGYAGTPGAGAAAAVRAMLVSASLFPEVLAAAMRHAVTVTRIVFDEADSLRLATVPHYMTASRFYWFVTASLQNLIPGASVRGEITIRHSDVAVSHFSRSRLPWSKSPYIRDFFKTDSGLDLGPFYSAITVVTDNAFVDESFRLEVPQSHTVLCTPFLPTRILSGIASRDVMGRLNAGDLDAALSYLHGGRADTESNIIAAALSQLATAMRNAVADQEYTERREYASPEAATAARGRAAAKVARIQTDIDSLTGRITEAVACPICFSDFDGSRIKTVLPCCRQSFCLPCIDTWVGSRLHAECPLCKAAIRETDFMVCVQPCAPRPAPPASRVEVGGVTFDTRVTKEANLATLLRALSAQGGRKVLFFSDNDYVNEVVVEAAMFAAGIQHAALKGNAVSIAKRLRDFRSGSGTQALLINCRNFGCGLDLSVATDLILYHSVDDRMDHQVVGRAQRPPRSSRLRIWRLLNVDEAQ